MSWTSVVVTYKYCLRKNKTSFIAFELTKKISVLIRKKRITEKRLCPLSNSAFLSDTVAVLHDKDLCIINNSLSLINLKYQNYLYAFAFAAKREECVVYTIYSIFYFVN